MPLDAGAPPRGAPAWRLERFGFTDALAGVDVTIRAGEVLALLGENGAGKSTLVKVLTGVIAPDSGTIEIGGGPFDALTPRRAEDLGIARVAQELSLFPEMDVAANVLIGQEPTRFGLVNRRALRRRTGELLGLLGVHIDPRLPVRQLALAERQLVEIAKAMARNPAILVLDEPTSGLREHEVEQLFHVMRRLREQGCAIAFISHRMDEVLAIADRITVLKDGRNSGEADRADAVRDDIIRMMVGGEVDSQFPPRPPAARAGRAGGCPAGPARRRLRGSRHDCLGHRSRRAPRRGLRVRRAPGSGPDDPARGTVRAAPGDRDARSRPPPWSVPPPRRGGRRRPRLGARGPQVRGRSHSTSRCGPT